MAKKDWVHEKVVSTKALPGEPIFSWIKWDEELVPKSITLKHDPDLEIQRMLNGGMGDRRACRDQITLVQKQLHIPGYFGFIASYKKLPEEEKTIDFVAEFDFGTGTKTLEYSTRIIRPILEFEQTEYALNSAGISKAPPPIDCKLNNKGVGIAEGITPFFKVENTSGMRIEMRTVVEEITDESLVFVESNEIRVPKLIIRGKGHGLVSIGFEYKDVMGNSYKSPLATLSIHIGEEQSLQIPITENISPGRRPIIQSRFC